MTDTATRRGELNRSAAYASITMALLRNLAIHVLRKFAQRSLLHARQKWKRVLHCVQVKSVLTHCRLAHLL